jgi:thiosulfate reductase cytochrome b subunit
VQLSGLAGLLGGYPMARWEHFWLMIAFFSFFLVHIAQVIRAGWDNFRSMVAGFSLVKTEYSPLRNEGARLEHHN